jgi:hypothetical protein
VNSLSPLILESARPQPRPTVLRELAFSVPDWEAITAQAARHGLGPLLYWHLHRTCPDALPSEVLTRLREQFFGNVQNNLLLAAELVRLTGAVERQCVDVLAFKGPTLAWTVYDNPGLRRMRNLDLLVRPGDARRVYDLLIVEGYRPYFDGVQWPFLNRWEDEVLLTRRGIAVDLHWRLAPCSFQLDRQSEAAWERTLRVSVAGGSIRTFGHEDLLLFLCVHGGKHCWSTLAWLGDVARLFGNPGLDGTSCWN